MVKTKSEVDSWIQSLSDEDMPGFAGTVAEVNKEISSDDTSAVDVARSVLKDPALTSRLLKMANSFFYNPNTQKISTVSRAVMILGFEQVKALALSLVLIDSLRAGHQRDRLTAEIAQSFHAAIQAQEFAKLSNYASPENVFIAALLSRLGHMAFWAFANEEASQLLELTNSGIPQSEAEKMVLKFSLNELSQGLGKSWSLGELLDKTFSSEDTTDPAVNLVKLSHQLADESKNSWSTAETKTIIGQLAEHLDVPINKIKDLSLDNAKLAKEITQLYGISNVSKKIPQPPLIDSDEPSVDKVAIEEEGEVAEQSPQINQQNEETSSNYPEPNPQLQLTILQDIANALEERPNFNIILEMTLEGLHRGVGMDRAGFAILTKDRQSLSFKYAIGQDNEALSSEFLIDISKPDDIFSHIIETEKAFHVATDYRTQGWSICDSTLSHIGLPPYLVMPTIVRGKVIGLFLADRQASKRPISQEDFMAFQQFGQQANMGLTFLMMQG